MDIKETIRYLEAALSYCSLLKNSHPEKIRKKVKNYEKVYEIFKKSYFLSNYGKLPKQVNLFSN